MFSNRNGTMEIDFLSRAKTWKTVRQTRNQDAAHPHKCVTAPLSTGRFRGNGNFSDRKSLGRKQRRSRQNINVKQQTKFAAATSVANSVRY